MSAPDFQLWRNQFGRLVFVAADGTTHPGVLPVRAFPFAAPGEGIAIVNDEGRELAWVERLADLPAAAAALLEEELACREFVPEIERLLAVSSFACPSTWEVLTDRGPTRLLLKGEEDIRRLGGERLLLTDANGVEYLIRDLAALDRTSRRLLDRFL